MGYQIIDPHTGEELGTMSCLSTSCVRTVLDMSKGNLAFMVRPLMSTCNMVMDMMEEDLGVHFTEKERKGIISFEDNPTTWGRHMLMTPFRVFTESNNLITPIDGVSTIEDIFLELIRRGADRWGAFLVCHLTWPSHTTISVAARHDQQWYLSLGGRNSEGVFVRLSYIFHQTLAMFLQLEGHPDGFSLPTLKSTGYMRNIYEVQPQGRMLDLRTSMLEKWGADGDWRVNISSGDAWSGMDDIFQASETLGSMFKEIRDEAHKIIIESHKDDTPDPVVLVDLTARPVEAA